MLLKIAPSEAVIGMYIASFDGAWMEHPFWRAKFLIRTQSELNRVRASNLAITIDTSKSVSPALARLLTQSNDGIVHARPAETLNRARPATPTSRPAQSIAVKRIEVPLAFGKAEKTRASKTANRSAQAVAKLFIDCQAGHGISIASALNVVEEIARTLDLSSAAFNAVTRLRSKDDATYMHSVAVSGLMIGFARELSLPTEEVELYGLAGLMHDIGKVSIPNAILQKEGALSADEIADIRRHPELGYDLLRGEPDTAPLVMDVCLHHHERIDGSGYPEGLYGPHISQAARVAAICDVYDALVSTRPYKKGMSGNAAMALMEDMAGHFDPALLFRFMRSAGYYRPGKLLKLRSRRLAIALPSRREENRPTVRSFYSTSEYKFIDYEDLVLSDRLSDDQAITQEEPSDWFEGDWSKMVEQIEAGRYPAVSSSLGRVSTDVAEPGL